MFVQNQLRGGRVQFSLHHTNYSIFKALILSLYIYLIVTIKLLLIIIIFLCSFQSNMGCDYNTTSSLSALFVFARFPPISGLHQLVVLPDISFWFSLISHRIDSVTFTLVFLNFSVSCIFFSDPFFYNVVNFLSYVINTWVFLFIRMVRIFILFE